MAGKRTNSRLCKRFFDGKPDQAGGPEFTIEIRITANDALLAVRNRIFHALNHGFLFRMMDTFFHNNHTFLNIIDNSRSRKFRIQLKGICMMPDSYILK